MPKQTAFNVTYFRRTALAFGALLLILFVTILASPAVRAFAGEQIRQFGAIFLSSAESGTEPAPQPTITAPSEMTAEFANSPGEAAVLAGFTVQAPAYLPAGYAENGPWSVDRRDSGIYVVSTYGSGEGNHFLLLNQTQFADEAAFNQSIGQNESMTDVMVGKNAAVYITGRLMAHPDLGVRVRNEAPELLPTNWLIWEADGTTYSLFGDDLDQAELVRIAESLSGS